VILALGLFPTGVRVGCLVALVALAALTSGERRRVGSGWWDLMAAGVALSIVGAVLALAAATAGGIVAIAGAALVLVGATLGFPPGD
jgi:membrane-bound ClpP family serine protease